jgi:hypothetical protein
LSNDTNALKPGSDYCTPSVQQSLFNGDLMDHYKKKKRRTLGGREIKEKRGTIKRRKDRRNIRGSIEKEKTREKLGKKKVGDQLIG